MSVGATEGAPVVEVPPVQGLFTLESRCIP